MKLGFILNIFSSFFEIFDIGTDVEAVNIYGQACNHCNAVSERTLTNWTLINEKYYYKVYKPGNSLYTFDKARQLCQESGGKLAEPHDSKTNVALREFHEIAYLWIGIEELSNGTMFYSSDKAKVEWKRKDKSPIKKSNESKCIGMKTLTSDWSEFPCNETKRGFVCQNQDTHPPMDLVILDTDPNNIEERLNTVSMTEFFILFGQITQYDSRINSNSFRWEENLGIITGRLRIKTFVEQNNRGKYFVVTKDWYEYLKCSKPGQYPCPYYWAGVISMLSPIGLGIISWMICLIITYRKTQRLNVFHEAFGFDRKWSYVLIMVLMIPYFAPFLKLTAWMIHHFSVTRSLCGMKFTVFQEKMDDRQLNKLEVIATIIMILNLLGEGIIQLILSCTYVNYNGSWKFTFFNDVDPKVLHNDFLILSMSVSIAAFCYGGFKSTLAIKNLCQNKICKWQTKEKEMRDMELNSVHQETSFNENDKLNSGTEEKSEEDIPVIEN